MRNKKKYLIVIVISITLLIILIQAEASNSQLQLPIEKIQVPSFIHSGENIKLEIGKDIDYFWIQVARSNENKIIINQFSKMNLSDNLIVPKEVTIEPGTNFILLEPGANFILIEPGTNFILLEPGANFILLEPGTNFITVESKPGESFSVNLEKDFTSILFDPKVSWILDTPNENNITLDVPISISIDNLNK